MAWTNEKEFGKFLMQKLNSYGMKSIRIETAATVNGMPDMYVMGKGFDYFIELKNMPHTSINSKHFKIQWRPGQQAFALEYKRCKSRMIEPTCLFVKYTWTFVGLKDGVLAIRMMHMHDNNIVECNDADAFIFNKKEFSELDISLFLRTHSHVVRIIDDTSVEDRLQRTMCRYAEIVFDNYNGYIDLPDAVELFSDVKVIDANILREIADMVSVIWINTHKNKN